MLSGPRTPLFSSWQTRKHSTTNQQWSLWLYTKHLMDMFPSFWIRRPLTFGKYPISHSTRGVPLITLLLGMLLCLHFQDLKGHRFLNACTKFLLSLILYKSFIQTQNWALAKPFLSNIVHVYYYANNHSQESIIFHKIFGTHLQKGFVYIYAKIFLLKLLFF